MFERSIDKCFDSVSTLISAKHFWYRMCQDYYFKQEDVNNVSIHSSLLNADLRHVKLEKSNASQERG